MLSLEWKMEVDSSMKHIGMTTKTAKMLLERGGERSFRPGMLDEFARKNYSL